MPFEFGSSRVIEVVVATDDDLSAQIGSTRVFNLIDFAQVSVRFDMRANQTCSDLHRRVSDELGGDMDQQRLWNFNLSSTIGSRPAVLRSSEAIGVQAGSGNQLHLYLKRNTPRRTPLFNLSEQGRQEPILLFVKRYDAAARRIHYVGSFEADPKTLIRDFALEIGSASCMLAGRNLQIWREQKILFTLTLSPLRLGPLSAQTSTLESCALQTGDIIVVQPELAEAQAQRIPAPFKRADTFFQMIQDQEKLQFAAHPNGALQAGRAAAASGELNQRFGAVRLDGRSHEEQPAAAAPLLPAVVARQVVQLQQAVSQALQDAARGEDDRARSLSSALEERNAEMQRLREELRQKDEDLQRLRNKLRENAEAMQRLRSDLAEREDAMQRLEAEPTELRRQLAVLRGDAEACRDMTAHELHSAVADMEAAEAALRQLAVERRVEDARQEATACPICLERAKDTRIDCGHLLCSACSQRVNRCPVCRELVTSRQRAFV